jgi:hypothetical protein
LFDLKHEHDNNPLHPPQLDISISAAMESAFTSVPPLRLMLVSDAIIDCRVRGLYNLLRKGKYYHTRLLLNDTIRELQTADEYECDPAFLQHVVDEMYRALVDMSFRKYMSVHNRLRDLHYEIFNKYV